MVGSAEKSAGGVASVIRLMRKMPVWNRYSCRWYGTQIQRNYLWKAWYAIRAAILAPFVFPAYDIVHIHTVPNHLGLIIQMPELLLAKLLRKKVIIEVHVGNQLFDNTSNRLFKWTLRKADLILLLAYKWQTVFMELYPDVHVPTRVLYNACDVVSNATFEEKEKSIIMAVYFNDNKAADILLKAWVRLKDKYPEWHLTLMGNGEVERFRKMAADLGLSGCVSFPGYVTGQEKNSIWRKASIYCMCSYNEGFPMVVLEAWAYGISVITTPVGGLPDVIEDGRNCLTIPFGGVDEMVVQLERLIDDDTLRKQMGEYSKFFVGRHFSLDAISEDLDDIYKHVLVNL